MLRPSPPMQQPLLPSWPPVCLFGIGVLLRDCYPQLECLLGRSPDYLCDNDPDKWGKTFFGITCISPDKLTSLPDNVIVLITTKHYDDIYRQLQELHMTNVAIVCYEKAYHRIHDVTFVTKESHRSRPLARPMALNNKWSLVTGASRGAGYQIAAAMARLGSNVVLHARQISHLQSIVSVCKAQNVHVLPLAADFSRSDDVVSFATQLSQIAPSLDIVFNNAAMAPPSSKVPWADNTAEFLTTYMVNTIAPVHITNAVLPSMLQRGFGRIINVTSSIERKPLDMAYACSKAALDKFVHDLAPSIDGTGVMICLLDPGWLRTDMGGSHALNEATTILPGALLGALLPEDVNGRCFSAQDYAGLNLEEALFKATVFSPGRKRYMDQTHAGTL